MENDLPLRAGRIGGVDPDVLSIWQILLMNTGLSVIDWAVMGGTILLIVGYGIWKSRGSQNIRGYLLSNQDMKWWTIGLSIMATQASAITFLSTPGQSYGDGMRFVQFYFGLPIALVIISMVAIPIYRRLNVYTAYEYLEQRFDLRTRTLGALLFLLGRSLAGGITIVAPAIILETILGWDTTVTCIGIGAVVMLYTVSGGTKAVSQTQQQQMAVMLIGMFIAGIIMFLEMPPEVGLIDALDIAGKSGKLNVITLPKNWSEFVNDRYNLLSGLVAGTFLSLSYFGTDQSQVQRYLGGKSVSEIRIGLMFNAIFKIPMQFAILFIGAMMYVFYLFAPTPMFFNEKERLLTIEGEHGAAYRAIEQEFQAADEAETIAWSEYLRQKHGDSPENAELFLAEALTKSQRADSLRNEGIEVIKRRDDAKPQDQDRVFLTFVLNHLPIGLVGLLMAVIFSAAMSSSSAELNALGSTTLVDIYKRQIYPDGSDQHYLLMSRLLTMGWGIVAIGFAITAGQFENLIEYVNILGSLFYGTILGLFVVAFFLKKIDGRAVFPAALMAEALVLCMYFLPLFFPDTFDWLAVGYLWLNLIGCGAVIGFSYLWLGIYRLRKS